MSDWWRGDEAVCIRSQRWWRASSFLGVPIKRFVGYGPSRGQAFTVIDTVFVNGELYLEFAKWPVEYWHAINFRKRDRIEGSKSAWRKLVTKHQAKEPIDA